MKKKILIIDDFIPLLEEVAEFLNFEGYKSYAAKDGTEGVQMAVQHIPDLIICDVEMPKMNGYEVFKTLEKIPATASIPFIFLTARAQAEDYKIGLQLGADDYITKPLELDNLLLSISKRLEKHDRLNEMHQKKFDVLLKNPLIGTFIYIKDQFVMTNDKVQEITGYTRSELNKTKLSEIIINDAETIVASLNSCLNNIHESVQLELSLLNKDKKAIFIEVFAKYVEIDSKPSLIGSFIEINHQKSGTTSTEEDAPSAEFEKIVDYLVSVGKDEMADEIINVKELIQFETKTKTQNVKNKIKLTKREKEILSLICLGMTNNEIAEKLFISNRTADNHRANLLFKTQTKNTASLVAFAYKNRLIKA